MLLFPENLYADVRIEDVENTNIRFENGALRQNKTSRTCGAFLRVYDGRRWYYSATTDLEHLQEALNGLAAMAAPNPDILSDPVVQRFQVNRDTVLRFADRDLRSVSNGDKVGALCGCLPVLDACDAVTVSQAVYADTSVRKTFRSSLGADITYDYQHCGIRLYYTLAAGDAPFDGSATLFSQDFPGLQNRQEELAAELQRDLDFARTAVPVEPGKYVCVLSPAVTGVFAHESFGHKSEADFMLGSQAMLKEWTIGSQVGSPVLNILDSGALPGSGDVPYDDEGTRAEETYLIKDGILAGRLHSATTAAALKEPVTGNARAVSFEYEPIVRMTSTLIGPGRDSLETLLREAEGGLYIDNYRYGTGMSTFTIAPNRAYRIRNGSIAEPVRISVISGNVMQTLHNIDGATAETKQYDAAFGGCGKMEQFPLRVAFGGPYIRVRDISVQ